MNGSPTPADPNEREIISQRMIPAPREQVFQAWIDPIQLAQWWGPNGFTNTFHEFEPRPGGQWRFLMHGPDGTDYPNHSVFVEVVPPQRIVLNHVTAPHFQIVATFEDAGEQTGLTFRMIFESTGTLAALRPIITVANEENFDRLEALLDRTNPLH